MQNRDDFYHEDMPQEFKNELYVVTEDYLGESLHDDSIILEGECPESLQASSADVSPVGSATDHSPRDVSWENEESEYFETSNNILQRISDLHKSMTELSVSDNPKGELLADETPISDDMPEKRWHDSSEELSPVSRGRIDFSKYVSSQEEPVPVSYSNDSSSTGNERDKLLALQDHSSDYRVGQRSSKMITTDYGSATREGDRWSENASLTEVPPDSSPTVGDENTFSRKYNVEKESSEYDFIKASSIYSSPEFRDESLDSLHFSAKDYPTSKSEGCQWSKNEASIEDSPQDSVTSVTDTSFLRSYSMTEKENSEEYSAQEASVYATTDLGDENSGSLPISTTYSTASAVGNLWSKDEKTIEDSPQDSEIAGNDTFLRRCSMTEKESSKEYSSQETSAYASAEFRDENPESLPILTTDFPASAEESQYSKDQTLIEDSPQDSAVSVTDTSFLTRYSMTEEKNSDEYSPQKTSVYAPTEFRDENSVFLLMSITDCIASASAKSVSDTSFSTRCSITEGEDTEKDSSYEASPYNFTEYGDDNLGSLQVSIKGYTASIGESQWSKGETSIENTPQYSTKSSIETSFLRRYGKAEKENEEKYSSREALQNVSSVEVPHEDSERFVSKSSVSRRYSDVENESCAQDLSQHVSGNASSQFKEKVWEPFQFSTSDFPISTSQSHRVNGQSPVEVLSQDSEKCDNKSLFLNKRSKAKKDDGKQYSSEDALNNASDFSDKNRDNSKTSMTDVSHVSTGEAHWSKCIPPAEVTPQDSEKSVTREPYMRRYSETDQESEENYSPQETLLNDSLNVSTTEGQCSEDVSLTTRSPDDFTYTKNSRSYIRRSSKLGKEMNVFASHKSIVDGYTDKTQNVASIPKSEMTPTPRIWSRCGGDESLGTKKFFSNATIMRKLANLQQQTKTVKHDIAESLQFHNNLNIIVENLVEERRLLKTSLFELEAKL